jgi:Spy/CpxP family protein refolding chaperone
MKKTILWIMPILVLAISAWAQCPLGGSEKLQNEKSIQAGGQGCGMGDEGDVCEKGGHQLAHGQCGKNPMMAKEIGLTEDQMIKMEALAMAHRKEMIKLSADLKITRLELDNLMENFENETAVRKKSQEMFKLKEKMYNTGLDHRFAMHKILTPDQAKKMKSLRLPMGGKKMMNKGCSGCKQKK